MEARIKSVKDVLERDGENLSIPDFQRPYCWNENNVRLLFQDVYDSWKGAKQSYRIGSVILHKSDEILQIVDGQQRITTILLILRLLENDFAGKKLCQKFLKYEHLESQQHIRDNNKFIENWIKEKIENEKTEFYRYLVDYCEFVEIVVSYLSEAFQMFESQNGRGKELEAYNLLKAYHIRTMETETQETKINCDKTWESATKLKRDPSDENEQEQDILKQVINEQLYRTRKWSKKNAAYDFNKSHISEFKGFTIDKQNAIIFPFQNTQLLNYIAIRYFESAGLSAKGVQSRFNAGDADNINSFVLINQNIINGKPFFDYIETYVEIYKRLFVDCQILFLKNAINKYCPRNGTGNEAMFELFKSLIFLVFDKFGENAVKKYWKDLYVIVYRLRLKHTRNVTYNQVADYPKDLFAKIEYAINDYDLICISERAKDETATDFMYRWGQDKKIKNFYKNDYSQDVTTNQKFKEKYKNDY